MSQPAPPDNGPKPDPQPDPPDPPPAPGPTPPETSQEIITGDILAKRDVNITNVNGWLMQSLKTRFSLDEHGKFVSMNEVQEIARNYIGDLGTIKELSQKLLKLRILVLTGEPDSGKRTTAMVMTKQLRWEFNQQIVNTYQVKRLKNQVSINFTADIIGNDSLHNSVVLFDDALGANNPDIVEFLISLGRHELEDLAAKLYESDIFIIFAANSATVSACRSQIQKIGILEKLPEVREEFLRKAITVGLGRFRESNSSRASQIESRFGASQQDKVIEKCRTISRVNALIECLEEILDGRLQVEEAIERSDYVKHWFWKEITDDFDSWCFVLTLTLLHGNPDFDGIPWVEFDYFRRKIARRLRREFNRRLRQESELTETSDAEKPGESLSDDYFLERCKAEVFYHDGTGIQMIRFIDGEERYRERLWDVLLSHNRQILTALLPELQRIAENGKGRSSTLAGSVIGRIGQLDPSQMWNIAYTWAVSGDSSLQDPMAHLFYTAAGISDSDYRARCLNYLEEWIDGGNIGLRTFAVSAYAWIGLRDLNFAMAQIGRIVKAQFGEDERKRPRDKQLKHRIEKKLVIDGFLDYIEDRLKSSDIESIDDWMLNDYLRAYEKGIKATSRQFSEREMKFLFTVERAIFILCSFTDCISVLSQLCYWMVADFRGVSAFTALIFLRSGGVAKNLEAKKVPLPDNDGNEQDAKFCSPIIKSLLAREDGVITLARFMRDLYDALSSFLPNVRRSLRKSFFTRLKRWAKSSFVTASCREAVESLYLELLKMEAYEVSEKLQEFIETDEDFSERDSELTRFATSVKKRWSQRKQARLYLESN